MIVFRFSNTIKLPLHWAYTDPWDKEYDEDTGESVWIDQREPGFQVWKDLSRVALALTGTDMDGTYGPKDYRYLLLIRATELQNSVGEWWAVLPRHVRGVRQLRSAEIRDALLDVSNAVDDEGYEDDDQLVRWVERRKSALTKRMWNVAKPVPTEFYETLPRSL